MIPAEVVAPKADYPRPQANLPFLRAIARTRETLQRIKELGYTVGSHINLYGGTSSYYRNLFKMVIARSFK